MCRRAFLDRPGDDAASLLEGLVGFLGGRPTRAVLGDLASGKKHAQLAHANRRGARSRLERVIQVVDALEVIPDERSVPEAGEHHQMRRVDARLLCVQHHGVVPVGVPRGGSFLEMLLCLLEVLIGFTRRGTPAKRTGRIEVRPAVGRSVVPLKWSSSA